MNLSIAFLVASAVAANASPPAPHEDVGVCPFECCTYREWETLEEILVLAKPEVEAAVVSRVPKSTKINALTGKVITESPGEFVVTRARENYLVNETIYLYANLGEGFSRVWYNGKWNDLNLGCCSDGSIPNCTTANDKDCWGKVVKLPRSTWWARIETPDHRIGWTRDTDKFAGQDACG